MLKLVGAAAFKKGIDTWLADMEKMSKEVLRGYCTVVYHRLALETPQWSGNAASNWRIQIGEVDTSTDSALLRRGQTSTKSVGFKRRGATRMARSLAEFIKGDIRAVQIGVARNSGRLAAIELGEPVFISNSSESLSGVSYIQYLEANPNNYLRKGNRPGGMVERAEVYGELGELSPAQIEALRGVRLGELSNRGIM